MTRVFFTMIVPLVLPTAVYLLWVRFAPGGGAAERGPASWPSATWVWLAGAGVVLALGVLVTAVETSGSRDGRYIPPHEENGRIVPGRTVPEHD